MISSTIFARIWTEQRYEETPANSGKPPREDSLRKWANMIMMAAAAGSVLLFFYEEITSDPAPWLSTANIIVDCVFLIDYVLRMVYSGMVTDPHAPERVARWKYSVARENYMVRWYGLVDLISVAPPLLYHTLNIGLAIGEFTRVARVLRLMRLARMLRLVKALRFLRETLAAHRRLLQHHRKIGMDVKVALYVIGAVVIGGGVMLHLMDENNFGDLGNSVYFSILNLTGQGNPSDLHTLGTRIIGVIIILCGLALVGIITGSFTTLLMERVHMHTSGNRPYFGNGHLLICGFSHILPEMLELLAADNEARDVVLLFDRGMGREAFIEEKEYPCVLLGRPLVLHWLRGNSSDIDTLRAAGAHNASHIALLSGDSSASESHHEDNRAQSLLALVQLRWLVRSAHEMRPDVERPAIPVTIEYVGDRFDLGKGMGSDFAFDWVSKDGEIADALFKAIPSDVTDVVVCGNNRSGSLLVNALAVKTPACSVHVLLDKNSVYIGDMHSTATDVRTGDPLNPADLARAGASTASCILLLADEGMPEESGADARTLQIFATLQSMEIRTDAVIVAQVFQESVGSWMQSGSEQTQECIAVRTDLSVARALLRNIERVTV